MGRRSVYVAGDMSPEEVIWSILSQEEHGVQVIKVSEDGGFLYNPLETEAETSLTEYEQEVVDNYTDGNSVFVVGGSMCDVRTYIKDLLKNPVNEGKGLAVICEGGLSDALDRIKEMNADIEYLQFVVGVCVAEGSMQDFVVCKGGKLYYDIDKMANLLPYLHTLVHIHKGQLQKPVYVPWLEKKAEEDIDEAEEEADYTISVHTIDPSFPKVDMHKLKEKFRKGKRFVVTGGTLGQRISFVTCLQKEGTILGSGADITFASLNRTYCGTTMVHSEEDVTNVLLTLGTSPQTSTAVSLLEATEKMAYKLVVHWLSTDTNGCITITQNNLEGIKHYIHKMGYPTIEILEIEESNN